MAPSSGFQAVSLPRTSDRVLSQLKEAIVKGRYAPGAKLPSERELIDSFGVSRIVIREAIRALEMTGFVTIRQGATGGAYVTDPSLDVVSGAYVDLFLVGKLSAAELRQVRRRIEPETARLAALNITEQGCETLRQALAQEVTDPARNPEDIARNTKIHYLVAELSGNRLYEAIVHSLLRLTEEIVGVVKPTETRLHDLSEHSLIVEAICRGDAPEAKAAMAEHVSLIGDSLSELETIYRSKLRDEE
ncbi:MAG: FadR family transcriptional regulator [Rhodospirillales bacterium]|nr:FadR family transcriptional regulator [Rhodospirillales bacterium]